MKNLSRSPKVPVEISPILLEESWREPLAVLLMGTDILRMHGGRLTPALREKQRTLMQAAGERLAISLSGMK